MAVYFIAFFIGAAGCLLLDAVDRKWPVGDLTRVKLILAGTLLILLSALRNERVGTDTVLYHTVFNALGSAALSDPIPVGFSGYTGYRILCRIVYLATGGSYRIMLFVISFIIGYGFLKFFYKKSDNPLMTTVYFVTLFYFFQSLNIHRQYMAMAVFLLAFLAFDEGKRFKGIILSVIAVSIHSVSAVMLIYLVLSQIKWTKPMFIMYTAIIAAGRALYEMFIDIFISFFPRYSFYDTYVWKAGPTRIFSISTIFLLLIIFSLVFFSYRTFMPLKASPVRCPDRKYAESLWMPMSFVMIDVILRFVYPANSSSVFPRLRLFFAFFSALFIPGVFERVEKKWRFWLYLGSNVIFLYTAIVRLLENDTSSYPYRFFWQ